MGLEPITSWVRTERTAARSPDPHVQNGGHDRIRTGDLERDKLAGTAGLPYVSTTQLGGGGARCAPTARLYEAALRTRAPATDRDAENFREGKNSGWCAWELTRCASLAPPALVRMI